MQDFLWSFVRIVLTWISQGWRYIPALQFKLASFLAFPNPAQFEQNSKNVLNSAQKICISFENLTNTKESASYFE